VKLNDFVIRSLNSRYTICLNYTHLEQLEPIAAALYKHLFYHFSNLYSARKRPDFTYTKNYESICVDWLGGLKVLPYRSKIEKEQLGRHFDALKKLRFVKHIEIQKNAKGDGFNIVVTPGKEFFKDYARFYKKQLQLAIQFHMEAEKQRHGDLLSLVQLFYEKLYGKPELTPSILSDKETDLARALLAEYSFHDLEDLITYTLRGRFKIRQGLKPMA
jgi:hypothetical protein